MITPRVSRIVRRVVDLVRERLPHRLDSTGSQTVDEAFALAGLARMADLLKGSLVLCEQDNWPVASVLGRSLKELWLYTSFLILDGENAIEQLFAEDQDHQHRLEAGRQAVWERLESRRPAGIDPRSGFQADKTRQRPNLADLAKTVRRLREEQGYGGGIAEVTYEIFYRWDSVYEAHPSLDLLFRYFDVDGSDAITVVERPKPVASDLNTVQEGLYQDARLVADALGLYLSSRAQIYELERVREELAGM